MTPVHKTKEPLPGLVAQLNSVNEEAKPPLTENQEKRIVGETHLPVENDPSLWDEAWFASYE